jgi:ribonuclease D
LVDDAEALQPLVTGMLAAGRVAVDIESNGMFAYCPRVCTVQLAWRDANGAHIAVVDTLAAPVQALAPMLESTEVSKLIHDLAFDARVLHQEGVSLANVRDTSVVATYLRKPATGLASLLDAELGISLPKDMQNSDWARRPLDEASIAYLANDVRYLSELEERLTAELGVKDLEDEVATETAYRLAAALQTQVDRRPAHLRIRGYDKLDDVGRSVLVSLCEARERIAEELNLPPQRIVNDRLIWAIAQQRPVTVRALRLIGGATRRLDERVRAAMVEAVRKGRVSELKLDDEPAAEEQLDRDEVKRRRDLEKRLHTWRRGEAERREIHEQAVIATHTIKRLVRGDAASEEEIASLVGLGRSRAQRYAASLARMVADGHAQGVV